jgi:hypothetical protein
MRDLPSSLNEYSTRAGTSAKTLRERSLSFSSSRNERVNILSDACGSSFFNSEKRFVPDTRWNSKIGFHFPPITATVVSTAQSDSVNGIE